jgi:arylesterase / paraoxonase
MKRLKKVILLILVLIVVFVTNIFISTGYFRTIEPHFEGEIVKRIAIPGAEDITVSTIDSFAIISSTNRGAFPQVSEQFGGLYYMELKSGRFKTKKITSSFKKPFAPHGMSMIKTDSTYKIMAINHTLQGHFIEIFKLNGDQLTFEKTVTDASMISPNDVVMIDENRFYFTNDHKYTKGIGRYMEDYVGFEASNVIYFDGEYYREVAKDIAYANGINFDAKRNLLFVASPRKFLIKVFSVQSNGDLEFIEDIDCNTGVDNIEFDIEGNLWVGAHPNLLRFAAYAKGKETTSPSEIIKIEYRNKNDYTVKTVYLEDGSEMSASTVAAPFGNLLITGNVMDDEFFILKNNN